MKISNISPPPFFVISLEQQLFFCQKVGAGADSKGRLRSSQRSSTLDGSTTLATPSMQQTYISFVVVPVPYTGNMFIFRYEKVCLFRPEEIRALSKKRR